MPNITELVHIIPPDADDKPEDIFAAAPGLIFTDDLRNLHGDPGSTIVYKSRRFGDIALRTADPEGEDERKLFSHYLWNAGIKIAELISREDDSEWSVQDQSVLELGAGVGLGGIVATLAGAEEVVTTDYPAPVVLANIAHNAKRNVPLELESRYRIQGHEWGDLTSPFALDNAHRFQRILAADCYWMPSPHLNLARSMLHFLTLGSEGRVFAVAGFHTGRATLASFFDVAADEGLAIEEIYEENAEGRRSEWVKETDGGTEDHGERKKWLVIGKAETTRGLTRPITNCIQESTTSLG